MSTLSQPGESQIETVVVPRTSDLGGFEVRRALPSAQRRTVGPFVFLDHMGPVEFNAGSGIDVRPHPHIGLSTLTYLFEGQLQHKDSLGSDQVVGAGDVSWMTAGSAIAHVERTPALLQAQGFAMHGLQVWLASPKEQEQGPGHYSHHPANSLPVSDNLGVSIRMIAGSGFCLQSPVPVLSPTLYAELRLQTATSLLIPTEHQQRALYVLEGEAQLDGEPLPVHSLVVLPEGENATLFAESDCHAVLIGGAALDGPRRINWNFVASDPLLIDEARRRWAAGDWPQVPGESERIELPPARH